MPAFASHDYVGRHHFRRECDFGDDVGIIAQEEIDQRKASGLRTKSGLWVPYQIKPGAFQ